MSAPAASIVVPTRGGRDRLPTLVRCLQAQSSPDWELVAVLDGDVDGSAEVLLAIGDERIRVVEFGENRGRSAALNAGHEAARGEVLIRCDDDLEPDPDYVAGHVAAHEATRCGVVGLPRNAYPESAYARVYGRAADQQFCEQAYAVAADQRWRYWAGNVSVSRAEWDLVGPYDTAFRAYGWEDVDWGYRLHRAGVPVLLVPQLEVTHRGAATSTRVRALRAYASGAARARFLAKHGPVLPPPPTAGWWDSLSTLAARPASEGTTRAVASVVDQVLPLVPAPVGHKLVAFTVETAARAGSRHLPQHDVTTDTIR